MEIDWNSFQLVIQILYEVCDGMHAPYFFREQGFSLAKTQALLAKLQKLSEEAEAIGTLSLALSPLEKQILEASFQELLNHLTDTEFHLYIGKPIAYTNSVIERITDNLTI